MFGGNFRFLFAMMRPVTNETAGGSIASLGSPEPPAVLLGGSMEGWVETASPVTPNGGMTTMRASHTATLLKDGTVLLAGGRDVNGGAEATAELYQ
jgi:hypothetical protein